MFLPNRGKIAYPSQSAPEAVIQSARGAEDQLGPEGGNQLAPVAGFRLALVEASQ